MSLALSWALDSKDESQMGEAAGGGIVMANEALKDRLDHYLSKWSKSKRLSAQYPHPLVPPRRDHQSGHPSNGRTPKRASECAADLRVSTKRR
jgi:hypothetical protein